jgi:hypothetical protein
MRPLNPFPRHLGFPGRFVALELSNARTVTVQLLRPLNHTYAIVEKYTIYDALDDYAVLTRRCQPIRLQ